MGKKTETACKMGRAPVSSFLFLTPLLACLRINLYVDQKLHLHFQALVVCYHKVAHIGWKT